MEAGADSSFAPGSLVAGRYRIETPLGRGGMAEVWGAVDERLDRPVALKALVTELAAEESFRERFATEARAVARLSHPNVVGVFDTGEHAGRPFLVMERLPGDTLADRLASGPLSAQEARAVAFDVLGALSAAHAAGIVHRDIKPANILLLPGGGAKVADFGIAKLSDPLGPASTDHTASNILVGTPAYVAPERVEGAPATPASDLYALGVVLYEALTGSKPFGGETPVAVALAAQQGAAPLASARPDVDPALARVVDRAMAADPGERYASAAEMASALAGTAHVAAPATATAAAVAPDATQVIRGRRAPTAPRPGPRRALAPILAAVAVVLVLAAVALASLGGDGDGAAATPPAEGSALAAEMRALAARLDAPNDGRRAPEAGDRLRQIAADLDRGDDDGAASEAEDLAADVRAWHDEDLLGNRATSKVLALLARVPGAELAQATTTTAPATSTSTTASTTTTTERPIVEIDLGDDDGKGKGKGRGD